MSKKYVNTKPFFNKLGDIVQTNTGSVKVIELVRGKFRPYDQFNYRYVKYKCEICNYVDYVLDNDLKNGKGCKICWEKMTVNGVNDIATLYPEKVHFFWDESEASKYKIKSNAKTDFKCECCGSKIANRTVSCMLERNVVLCHMCKDNTISWGEKMMWSILNQLQEEFVHDNATKWSNGRRYDFILENKKAMIEIDGMQHSIKAFNNNKRSSIDKTKENDKYKDSLANENGFKVYRIPYLNNSVEDFLLSIKNNNLDKILNIDGIDIKKVKEDMIRPLDHFCVEEWNAGNRSVYIIADKLKLNPGRVRIALKKAAELGLCDYNAEDARRLKNIPAEDRNFSNIKPVICLNNLFIFDRMVWAFRYANTKKVLEACKGKRKHAGKDPETGEKLSWQYLEDFLREHEEYNNENFISEHRQKPILKGNRF